jgi:hypothetical protein
MALTKIKSANLDADAISSIQTLINDSLPSEFLLVGKRSGSTQVSVINSIITVTTRTGSVQVGVT